MNRTMKKKTVRDEKRIEEKSVQIQHFMNSKQQKYFGKKQTEEGEQ